MISHSLIVGALLVFSLSAHAGAIAMDGMPVAANPADAATNLNAVLHRDVGLNQGGGMGRDAWEAPAQYARCINDSAARDDNDALENSERCASGGARLQVKSVADLFAVNSEFNRESASHGSILFLFLMVIGVGGYCCWRSPSTK